MSGGHLRACPGVVYSKGRTDDNSYICRAKGINNKAENNGIVDEKVYKFDDINEENNVALSKNDFAELVYSESEYAKGFDFSLFNNIFDVIRSILSLEGTH